MSNSIYLNCSYLPPELFVAAGLKPVRLWPEQIGMAGQDLIPADICPYTRAVLSKLYDNNDSKSTNKRAVIANSCDGMRRLYDIISDNSFLLEVPIKSGVDEVNYYYKQLLGLLAFLHIDYDSNYREKLRRVITEYNKQRGLLKKIMLTGTSDLLLAGIKIYSNHSQGNLEEVSAKIRKSNNIFKSPRILLSSSCLLDGQIVDLIERNNLQLAAIDSCLGERAFNLDINVDKDGDVLKLLAKSYLQKTACPRSMEPGRRLKEINRLVKSRNIDGIIYFIPKFCDQAGYDFKYLKDWAKQVKIPVLNLEGEYNSGKSGQLNTRIAAFSESLIM